MRLLERAYKLSHELMWVEVPLLLAEGRVRYGFRWADLARITDTDLTPQALLKRHASTVATIIRVVRGVVRNFSDRQQRTRRTTHRGIDEGQIVAQFRLQERGIIAFWRQAVVPLLLSGGIAVSSHDTGRHPAPLLDVDALLLGPRANRVGIDGARAPPAGAAGPARAAELAGMRNVLLQSGTQFLAVRRAKVDLVLGAVQAEADGALGLTAVNVIDVESLYLLGHGNLPLL